MPYDINKARQAGATDTEIIDELMGNLPKFNLKYDLGKAKQAGATDVEIADELASRINQTQAPSKALISSVPDSPGYIAQSYPAMAEALVKIPLGLAGGATGALVHGGRAVAGGRIPTAEEIREGISEGSRAATEGLTNVLTGQDVFTGPGRVFAPTEQIEKVLGSGFEQLRSGIGTVMEYAAPRPGPRTGQAQASPEALRTVGETAFDVAAYLSPYGALKRGARQANVNKLEREVQKGQEFIDQKAQEAGVEQPSNLRNIVEEVTQSRRSTIQEVETPAKQPKEYAPGVRLVEEPVAEPIGEREFLKETTKEEIQEGQRRVKDILGPEKAEKLEQIQPEVERQAPLLLEERPGERRGPVKPIELEPEQLKLPFSITELDRILDKPGFTRTAEETKQVRDYERSVENLFRGPGDKQRGFIEFPGDRVKQVQEFLSTLFGRLPTTGKGKHEVIPRKPSELTNFEKEENLSVGSGVAVPDLEAPIGTRALETLETGKDIGIIGRWMMNAEQITKFYDSSPLTKAIIDRIMDIRARGNVLRKSLIEGMEYGKSQFGVTALRKFKRTESGFRGMIARLNTTDKINFFKTLYAWENSDILKQQGLQWPNEQMLRDWKLNNEVNKAYQKWTEYADIAYDLVNQARVMDKKPPIPRIPGYAPHLYKGHIGISIWEWRDKEDGTREKYRVAFARTSNKFAIRQVSRELIQEAQSKGFNVKPEDITVDRMDHPNELGSLVGALEAAYDAYSNGTSKFAQLMQRGLSYRIASLEHKVLASELKRKGVAGWIASSGVKEKHLSNLERGFNNWMSGVISYWEAAKIRSELQEPLLPYHDRLTREQPNSWNFIDKIFDISRGKYPLGVFEKLASDTASIIHRDTLPYRSPKITIQMLKRLFSIKDLAGNVGFYSGNLAQFETIGYQALLREYSRIGKGNPKEAVAKGYIESFNPNPLNMDAIKWAEQRGVFSPRLMEEIDIPLRQKPHQWKELGKEVLTLQRAGELTESQGRLRTFVTMLEYYRSAGFTEKQARGAASKAVEDIMVDYSAIGVPQAFTATDIIGQSFAQYAPFRHAFWGHMALAAQQMIRNPKSVHSWTPFLMAQGSLALWAGLRGTFLFGEYAAFAHYMNTKWEEWTGNPGPLPDPMKFLLKSGLGDFTIFGALSAGTKAIPQLRHGADIGSVAAAPISTEAGHARPIEGAVETAIATSTIIAKTMLNEQMTNAEKLRFFKSITPSWMNGTWEFVYSPDEQLVIDERTGKGKVRREEPDWAARILTGKPSLKEKRELLSSGIIREEESRGKERKADLADLASDTYISSGYIPEEIIQKAINEGYSYSEFRRRVMKSVERKQRTRIEQQTAGKRYTENLRRRRQSREELLYQNEGLYE